MGRLRLSDGLFPGSRDAQIYSRPDAPCFRYPGRSGLSYSDDQDADLVHDYSSARIEFWGSGS